MSRLLPGLLAGCAFLLAFGCGGGTGFDSGPPLPLAYTITDLGRIAPNSNGIPHINNRGEVAGSLDIGTAVPHATLWRNGQIIDLGDFGGPAYAAALNNVGHVVVNAGPGGGDFSLKSYLWQNGSHI